MLTRFNLMVGKSVPYKVTFSRRDAKDTEFVYIFNFEEKSDNPLENAMEAYNKSLAELKRFNGMNFDKLLKIEPMSP